MCIKGLKANETMITKINIKIYGRQFVDNGKYIIARAPNWKDV
jgi:hypothetical protein